MANVIPKLVTIQMRTGFYTMEDYTAGFRIPLAIVHNKEQLAVLIENLTEAGRINHPGAKYVQYCIGIDYEE